MIGKISRSLGEKEEFFQNTLSPFAMLLFTVLCGSILSGGGERVGVGKVFSGKAEAKTFCTSEIRIN